jgi:type II secretory pathway pseudopilin PulG
MTLIEITISIAVMATIFLVTASAFTSTLRATEQARRTTSASIFLEATLESVSAQPYQNLLSLNGNQVFDVNDAGDSNYRTDISAFLADVNLIQVTTVLTDLRSGRVLGRVNTLRANR